MYYVRVSLWTVKIFLAQPVLGIRDILVLILIRIRIRIPGSVPLTNGSGAGSRPTPDPTTFLIDFKDAKKIFSYFFLTTCSQSHHRQTKKFIFLLKFSVTILFQALFQSAQHIYEKRERSEAGSGSVPLTNGSGARRPKNMSIRWIRIPNTVRNTKEKGVVGTVISTCARPPLP
jgi:hypothetical protein